MMNVVSPYIPSNLTLVYRVIILRQNFVRELTIAARTENNINELLSWFVAISIARISARVFRFYGCDLDSYSLLIVGA
jgi:hypothetical protein